MKRIMLLLALGSTLGCSKERNQAKQYALRETLENNSASYPLFIDGGTKVVYQFGQLTADKGLKLYFDTIPHPAGGLKMDNSLRKKLSPEK